MMKCPVCGMEMCDGAVESVTDIVWLPEPSKIKKPRNAKGAKLLKRNEDVILYYCVDAKRCADCGLIVIE